MCACTPPPPAAASEAGCIAGCSCVLPWSSASESSMQMTLSSLEAAGAAAEGGCPRPWICTPRCPATAPAAAIAGGAIPSGWYGCRRGPASSAPAPLTSTPSCPTPAMAAGGSSPPPPAATHADRAKQACTGMMSSAQDCGGHITASGTCHEEATHQSEAMLSGQQTPLAGDVQLPFQGCRGAPVPPRLACPTRCGIVLLPGAGLLPAEAAARACSRGGHQVVKAAGG